MTSELGGTNAGALRVGGTVRRVTGPWTPSIHAVMRFLDARAFPVPKLLGVDNEGREVLEWVEGSSEWERHAELWADERRLAEAARLLLQLHQLLDEYEVPPGAMWRAGWGRNESTRGPLCHHDYAPWNVLVRPDGQLTVIDWDGVAPGDRMAELAYAVCGFVPLRRESECRRIGWSALPDSAGRVEVFWRAYGLPDSERPQFADALVECARGSVRFGEAMHRQGREPFASWWAKDQGQGDRDDLAATELAVLEWHRRFPAAAGRGA